MGVFWNLIKRLTKFLIDFLEKKTLHKKDIPIIYNLYYNQTATVKVENELSNDIEIKRVVRKECVLWPLLFNMYSEDIIQAALSDEVAGV